MSELYIAELKSAGLADRSLPRRMAIVLLFEIDRSRRLQDSTSRLSGRPNNDVADIDIGGLLDGESYGAGDSIG